MIRLCILFFVCVVTKASNNHESNKKNIRPKQSKIIGGSFVDPDTYPWFTMLLYKGESSYHEQGCGGTLVSSEFVLTAAHCINGPIMKGGAVKIGALSKPYTETDNGGQHVEFRTVSQIFVHPKYNSQNMDNDFALLQLTTPSLIDPVEMDSTGFSEKYSSGKDNLWVAGFGMDEKKQYPDDLKHASLQYVSNYDCTISGGTYSFTADEITENMICAIEQHTDSCYGDSGGPLFDKDANILVGIVSWGKGCALPNYPGVYARVSSGYNWIQDIICDYSTIKPLACQSCSVRQTRDKTHYVPFENYCWKIELFEGGILDIDISDPLCTNKIFKSSGALSMFNQTEGDVYHFSCLGLNYDERNHTGPKPFDGRFTLKQNPFKHDFHVEIISEKPSSGYDVDLFMPSCNYYKCLPGEKEFRIDILPDRWPEETSWDLVNDCTGKTVLTGNAFGGKACIPDDQYTFTIYDTYNDGICCDYGSGSYEVYYDDDLIKKGGDFSSEESVSFGSDDCSCFGVLEGETIYVPVYSVCWKIEFFNNGVVSADYSNPDCSGYNFTKDELVISSFSHMRSNVAYFVDESTWSGTVSLRENPSHNETKVDLAISSDSKEFELNLSFPTCPLIVNW